MKIFYLNNLCKLVKISLLKCKLAKISLLKMQKAKELENLILQKFN